MRAYLRQEIPLGSIKEMVEAATGRVNGERE